MAGVLSSCQNIKSQAVNSIGDNKNLDAMIGQMIMVGFRGLEVGPQDAIVQDIRSGRVGGVILFDRDVAASINVRNIQSPQQVKALIKQLKSYAKIPLFVAVDQEGGKVARLRPERGFRPTISAARQKPGAMLLKSAGR